MKNVHVIPTDKPSRLFDFMTKLMLIDKIGTDEGNMNRHIYITSDEDIKEGDWVYSKSRNKICKVTGISKWTHKDDYSIDLDNENYFIHHSYCKKIILTTDPSLAPDVYKIDDEFLQWFVENPTCEEVEVEKYCSTGRKCDNKGLSCHNARLKIVIPKEEPKQEYEYIGECKGNDGNGCFMDNPAHNCGCFVRKLKKETLEEAAEKCFKYIDHKNTFIAGAKWQAERMYSEEEVLKLLINFSDDRTFLKKDVAIKWFKQFKKK